ncbi:hypothetical protein OF83DRAFT_1175653 [Amylostereum chailletii]|nr:hypothetical protein OF83DRAFT_1175653 [Amylostereum chailletii]
MALSFGPTLRKLDLHDHVFGGFFPPADLSTLTASLFNLEVLFVRSEPSPSYEFREWSKTPLALPASLPRLCYLRIDLVPFVFPTDLALTHVHDPTPSILPSILTSSLTHLSLSISQELPLDVYDSIPQTAPNLVSLALFGGLPAVTRILNEHRKQWVDGILPVEK